MIKSSGRGDYVPVADNSTPEGRAINRRVEVKIYILITLRHRRVERKNNEEKNLMSVLILALVLVNTILTAILAIGIIPSVKKSISLWRQLPLQSILS